VKKKATAFFGEPWPEREKGRVLLPFIDRGVRREGRPKLKGKRGRQAGQF